MFKHNMIVPVSQLAHVSVIALCAVLFYGLVSL